LSDVPGKRYFDDDRPWYSRLDPNRALDLGEALLVFGDLETAKRYAALHLAFGPPTWWGSENPPPGIDPRDVDFRRQWLEHERLEHVLCEELVAQLAAGALRATGFEPSTPADSPPVAIHASRWRILTPDLANSSASALGITITGIRVVPATLPRIDPHGSRPATEVRDRSPPPISQAALTRFVARFIRDAGNAASEAGLLRAATEAGIRASRDRIRAAFPASQRRPRGRPKK
jgi:hypothetical protein